MAHTSINDDHDGSGSIGLSHETDSFSAEISLRWNAKGIDPERDSFHVRPVCRVKPSCCSVRKKFHNAYRQAFLRCTTHSICPDVRDGYVRTIFAAQGFKP